MAAKFISNQRGGHKLIYEGHSYIKHRHMSTPLGEVTYWRCDQIHRFKCPGFARTSSRNDEVRVTRSHSHAPSSARIEVLIAKSDIRQAAINAISATPRTIVANALEGISDAAKHQLPKIANLKKTASRQRKSIGDGAATDQQQQMANSKETLRKRLVQNYRRNALGGHSQRSRAVVFAYAPLLEKPTQKAAENECQNPSIISAALDVVLKDSLPLGFIERPAMRSLLKAVLELGKMGPSSASLGSLPGELALRMEMGRHIAKAQSSADFEHFFELLKSVGCLSYEFDECCGQSFVTIKGHVLNEQFELLSATLIFKECSGVSQREALAMEMGKCLSEQLGFSTAELAKMHHAIADGTIEVPFENARLCHVCLCDVLNNVVEHTTCPYADSQLHNRRNTMQRLNELNRLIERIRVIVFWICGLIGDGSAAASAVSLCPSVQLRLFSPSVGANGRRRRFADTVAMLSSFVSQLEEVDAVLRNSERIGGEAAEGAAKIRTEFEAICTHKDELEAYLMTTEPIVEWIELFEESDQPSIHRALPALAGIENGLNTLRMLAIQSCDGRVGTTDQETVPNSTVLQRELCEAALDALDWNISPLRGAKVNKHLLCTAAALDPSAWRRELPSVFAKVARWTEEEVLSELRMSFAHGILFESHRRQMQKHQHNVPRHAVPSVKRPLFSCADEAGAEGAEEEDEGRDEVAEFVTAAKQYRHTPPNSGTDFDLFSYWNNELASHTFPNLRALSRQILCVPGGHIGTERIFSAQKVNNKLEVNGTELDINCDIRNANAKFAADQSPLSLVPAEEAPPHCAASTSALSSFSSNGTAGSLTMPNDDHRTNATTNHYNHDNHTEWDMQQNQCQNGTAVGRGTRTAQRKCISDFCLIPKWETEEEEEEERMALAEQTEDANRRMGLSQRPGEAQVKDERTAEGDDDEF